ncbi:acyl-CoA thioesterase-2 [Jatrophihabitans sp. GAS493]|nr:acyl-CoA thioesterase-2 [Jatrophihabitans sp. GAS493]
MCSNVTAESLSRHGADSISDLGTDFVPDVDAETKVPGTGLDGLLHLLDLEKIEENIFRGLSPKIDQQRIFGGQVAGQALIAAGRTVDADRPVHSLHSYFIRPGDPTTPVIYTVDRVRDGRSFATRRVLAVQHGEPIFSLSASFQLEQGGIDHQSVMPDVPSPASLPSVEHWQDEFPGLKEAMSRFTIPIDIRYVDDPPWVQRGKGPRGANPHRVWMRANGYLPNDPLVHVCAMTFASDITLLDSVLVHHGLAWRLDPIALASLDHAMWFHRPFRADEWFLYTTESPTASGGRGLATGQMYSQDGRLLASVVQEGVVRVHSA